MWFTPVAEAAECLVITASKKNIVRATLFLHRSRSSDGRARMAGGALAFVIRTASRTDEIMDATWSEINFDNPPGTIPAARTKAGREHPVPLSGPAMSVLMRCGLD